MFTAINLFVTDNLSVEILYPNPGTAFPPRVVVHGPAVLIHERDTPRQDAERQQALAKAQKDAEDRATQDWLDSVLAPTEPALPAMPLDLSCLTVGPDPNPTPRAEDGRPCFGFGQGGMTISAAPEGFEFDPPIVRSPGGRAHIVHEQEDQEELPDIEDLGSPYGTPPGFVRRQHCCLCEDDE